jgi:hypothetical protein
MLRSILIAASSVIVIACGGSSNGAPAPEVGSGASSALVFAPTAPMLSWSPSANSVYGFAAIGAGQSAVQTFTLTNSDGSATGALTVTLSGPAAFTLTADGCTATSIGPGKNCSVTVTYAPSSASECDFGSLTAIGKKPASTATLALTGPALACGQDNPIAIAVDSTNVYWVTLGSNITPPFNGTVMKVPTAGGTPISLASGTNDTRAIAIDGTNVYWVDRAGGTVMKTPK